MTPSITLREGLVVGGFALLCAAAGVAMLVEGPGKVGPFSMAEAVDLLRLWARS